ncbi:hypothetical protein F5884DRAFT_754137 [Xylogone sp. PMI_703]|nr:hypothetical protein F5884DRAFT_754137 [Xylogone sp. PMI_703]
MRNMLFDSDGRLLPMTHSNQLFGAHGQPLGTTQLQIAPPDNHPASSPASSPNSNTEYPTQVTGRKRARQDPHPFILPPPIPSEAGHQRAILRRRPPIEYDLKPTETTAIRSAGEGSGLSPDSVGCTISILQPLSQPAPRRRATLPRSSSSNRSNPMSLDNIVGRVPNVGINETCSDNI